MVTRCVTSFAAVLLLASVAQAQSAIGRVVALRGKVTAQHAHGGDGGTAPLKAGDEVHATDVLQTDAGASLRLLMSDKSLLNLGEKSRVSLAAYTLNGPA